MGVFDGWKKGIVEAADENQYEDNPEIKKLKEQVKVTINERGQADSEEYFRKQQGLAQYGREANYINTNSETYKTQTTSRYQAGFHSGSGSKAPNLNRSGMQLGPTQSVNTSDKSYHSQQIGPMGKLGSRQPLGMAPVGMDGNDAVKSNQNGSNSSGSGGSGGATGSGGSKLTRPF